jgi:hypothetical protein
MSSPRAPSEIQEYSRPPYAQFFHLIHLWIVDAIPSVTPFEKTAHLAVRGQAEYHLPDILLVRLRGNEPLCRNTILASR